MKTAVIISGQMRTFKRCYPTQRWQVYRHYEPDIHFFVSCLDDENANSAELLLQHYENVHIEKYQDPTHLPEIPSQFGDHAPYANATSHKHLMLQHWGNMKAWQFFWKVKGQNQFDVIIRTRADNLFHRFTAPGCPLFDHCFTPWWGKFGGVNDRFAIMGYAAANAYFNTFSKIDVLLKLGCPFHPESLVAESMRQEGIVIRSSLMAHFSTLRTNGDLRWPEVTAEDIAELITNETNNILSNH